MARREIVEAQEIALQLGYRPTATDIRKFRQESFQTEWSHFNQTGSYH